MGKIQDGYLPILNSNLISFSTYGNSCDLVSTIGFSDPIKAIYPGFQQGGITVASKMSSDMAH